MTKERLTLQSKDFSRWYNEVVSQAELAEHSVVRGCMIIRPYGYALWENFQKILDQKIKETGHANAYFPLFIPKSFFNKEAEHAQGFAKECAVVTHSRLKSSSDGEVVLDPASKLEEELIVRPTSETIIHSAFSRWIQSYRDLPLLINQWANIVRWERRPRLFLRTTEFLWQEGHTAHASAKGAEEEALKMLGVYKKFIEEYLAISVLTGKKSELEKFAGAKATYAVEAMMRDKKALQMGTSHDLGQGFSKAFDIKFSDKDGDLKYVWQTSWGVSTRLIGALIMAHGDDQGLIIPPRVAPIQVVLVPIFSSAQSNQEVESKALELKELLGERFRVKVDFDPEKTPGFKFNKWELRGVPLRLELGPKDLDQKQVVVVRRDTGEKQPVSCERLADFIDQTLASIQAGLLESHRRFTSDNTKKIDNYADFKKATEKGGFIQAFWCQDEACEKKIKEEIGATTRCLPLDSKEKKGKCILCEKDSSQLWVFSQAY